MMSKSPRERLERIALDRIAKLMFGILIKSEIVARVLSFQSIIDSISSSPSRSVNDEAFCWSLLDNFGVVG